MYGVHYSRKFREKAHPDVFNIMLQLLDDGRVTDSKGNVVNFCNCIVIFTSNVGSQTILDVSSTTQDPGAREVCEKRSYACCAIDLHILIRLDDALSIDSVSFDCKSTKSKLIARPGHPES